VRLTELIYSLLDKVDAGHLAFNPAVELSYLSQVEQTAVVEAMDKYGIKPSLSQATRLKKLRQALEEGENLTTDRIDTILSEVKKPAKGEATGSMRFREYFPPEYSQKQMDAVITALLKGWKAEQKQSRNGDAAA